MTRYLEGRIEPESDEPDVITSLQRENRELRQQLAIANQEVKRARAEADEAVSALRPLQRQLTPLYKALQGIFGEIERVAGSDSDESAGGSGRSIDPRVLAVWQVWKDRLGGTVAKGIDALLTHRELDTTQLAIAAGVDRSTVTRTIIYRLNQAKLINKSGGRYSLKQL